MQLIDSGKQTAAENMRLDEQLLEELDPYGFPILRFYEFSAPAATYGYFLKPEEHLREGHGLDLARRPTGGGILFHLWDLTFSVLIPAHHEGYSTDVMQNYKYINDRVVEAIGLSCHLLPDEVACSDGTKHFCFAKPTKFDVMWQGKKLAGAAQRRKQQGFLHQGSIALVQPDFSYLRTIVSQDVVAAMQTHCAVLGQEKKRVKAALQQVFIG